MNGYLIKKILQKGKKIRCRFFDVFLYETSKNPDVAVICSTKVSKSAVKRNRLKRQLREIINLKRKAGGFTKQYVLVVLKKEALEQDFNGLTSNLEDGMRA